ncbi:MAG: glycoside hydrolase family 97 catalytic domain-containing protein [Phycisphaerae bacterium]|nr:glycoside hydrolase family 97 catalytic domain-containing protein [Phycisphaerae bacterium]
MKLNVPLIIAATLALQGAACMAGPPGTVLRSPDQTVAIAVQDIEGKLYYTVQQDDQAVIESSRLGLVLDGEEGNLAEGYSIVAASTKTIDETYPMPASRRSLVRNHCNEMTIDVHPIASDGRPFKIILRAYNDGAAVRYIVPGKGKVKVKRELTNFKIPAGSTGWAMRMAFNDEITYDHFAIERLPSTRNTPILLKLPGKRYALLHEAALRSYPALNLTPAGSRTFRPFLPNRRYREAPFTVSLPLATPWRVIVTGPTLANLVESDLIDNLNPPCELDDISWIKPGKVLWNWWGNNVIDENTRGKLDMPTMKIYIDMGPELGAKYLLVDAGWPGRIKPKELVKYANDKGMEIILWYHSKSFPIDKADERMAEIASWGVKGVKIDFMDSKDEKMVDWYLGVSRIAAKHKLLVNFHGAFRPTGERRTLPNMITREGIHGSEFHKVIVPWRAPKAEEHCLNVFTRMVVGPMDYCPTIFSDNRFGIMKNPISTTWAHQLALLIVFESPLQHMADYPGSYRDNPARDLIRRVPAAWDDIKLLTAEPTEYVALARRKGKEWYIGCISAGKGRTLDLKLDFLGKGKFTAEIYADNPKDRRAYTISKRGVTSASRIKLVLSKDGGGAAIRIAPLE